MTRKSDLPASASAADVRPSSGFSQTASLCGAALMGLGLIMWVASNWAHWSALLRLGLLQAALLVALLTAWRFEAARPACAWGWFVGTGALLALFGQVYQSGADPWQLFAWWAALTLPVLVANRSHASADALCAVWVVVLSIAVQLAVRTVWEPSLAWGERSRELLWLLLQCAVLGAVASLRAPAGAAQWAWRCGVLLAMVYGIGASINSLFVRSGPPDWAVFAAVFALVMCAWAWHRPGQRDDVLIQSAAGLAAVVLLNIAITRWSVSERADWKLVLLGMGTVTMLTLAAATFWLMRGRPDAPAAVPPRTPADTPDPDGGLTVGRPWPVQAMGAVGAWLTAVLLAFPIGALASSPGGRVVSGIGLLAAAMMCLRLPRASAFVEQVFFPLYLAGMGLLMWASTHNRPPELWTWGLGALLAAIPWAMSQRAAVQVLMGALAIACTVGAALEPLQLTRWSWPAACLGGASVAALALASHWRETARLRRGLALWRAGLGGLALAIVITAFGAGQAMGMQTTWVHGPSQWLSAPGDWVHGAVALAAMVVALAWAFGKVWRTQAAAVRAGSLAACIGLALLHPSIGWAIAWFAAARGLHLRHLSWLAAAGVLWAVLSVYGLAAPSFNIKAAILVACGALLALAALGLRTRVGERLPVHPLGWAWCLAAVATLVVVNVGIAGKERILRQGDTVLLRLAPIDPRSIMQGDYMALRFELPPSGFAGPEHSNSTLWVATNALSTDAQPGGVLSLRFERRFAPNEPLERQERIVRLKRSATGWTIGTDAYYFPEGQAARFELARYGVFKLSPQGDAILTGLADAQGGPIE